MRLSELIYHMDFLLPLLGKPGQEDESLGKDKKRKDAAGERILSFWQKINREGAEFFVDGECVLPADAYTKAVKEDGVYMTDYVWGEEGKIKQVRLNKVDTE